MVGLTPIEAVLTTTEQEEAPTTVQTRAEEVGDKEAPEPEAWEEDSGPEQPPVDCWDTCLATEGTLAMDTEATTEDITEAGEVEDTAQASHLEGDHGEEEEHQHPLGPGQLQGSEERGEDKNEYRNRYFRCCD